MNDVLIEHTNEDGAERAAAKIAEVVPALREAGIETVVIEYDGSHDEGSFYISPKELPNGVSQILDEHLPAILPSGWDADDGSFGTVTIDVTRSSLVIDHHSRYSNEEDENWTARITPDPAHTPDFVAAIGDLLGPLREAGITHVYIHYDGCGDSGAIERIDPQTIPEALQKALEEHAYNLLPGGWEINEGSCGVIAIDVNKGHLVVDHKWRTIETENSKHSYQLF
jgi:hypothetical protein